MVMVGAPGARPDQPGPTTQSPAEELGEGGAPASATARPTIRSVGQGSEAGTRWHPLLAQIGIVGFDGQIELEAQRLYSLPEAAPALLCGTPTLSGTDTHFVVTNLAGGTARWIYEDLYCQRGQAENHIKAWRRHLATDRTSCSRATANQLRLTLHTGAYWLLWSLRSLMPKRSTVPAARTAEAMPPCLRSPRAAS
jgi:hypothetical protein